MFFLIKGEGQHTHTHTHTEYIHTYIQPPLLLLLPCFLITTMSSSSRGNLNNQDLDGGAAAKRLRGSSSSSKSPPEPTSVLYNRSPSPPTSSSHSSSAAPEPPPISAEDWDAVFLSAGPAMAVPASAAPHHSQAQEDSSFLRWIMDTGYADGDADAFGFKSSTGAAFFDPSFLNPQSPAPQQQQEELFALPQQLPLPAVAQREEILEPQGAVDELLEAARLADAGDSTGAREILARLNHHGLLPPSPPPPGHPPLLRAAALLRDALLLRLLPPGSGSGSVRPQPSPLDVALKLAAHKAMADASPAVQFASFTSTQAFLDAAGAGGVHLVDFDLGFGAHWPPLMQELAHSSRRASPSAPAAALKLTALVSASGSPMELRLSQESLTRFAADLGIPFEFAALTFDPSSPMPGLSLSADETVAVHVTVGGVTSAVSPATLRLIKQLRPAIVVCVDHGGGCDMPLPSHALNVLRSSAALLESLAAGGASPDVVTKVEQFVLRPRVERGLVPAGGDKLPPWRSLFASAGFAPLQLSNAAEAQAECLLRRTAASHGFHAEKRQPGELALCWRRSELVSVSAWRC